MLDATHSRRFAAAALTFAAVWLGMLIGVSFVATPVKFTVSSLDLGTALEVGRATFALFNSLEWALLLITLLMVFLSSPSRYSGLAVMVLVTVLILQTAWLLPALDARVEAVLASRFVAPSWHHNIYAGLEAIKAIALLVIVVAGLARLCAARRPATV